MKVVHYITEDGKDPFQDWLDALRDSRAKITILRRIDRAVQGNLGDHKACREGVFEMRVDVGPGYRVYYFQHGQTLVVLLCAGDKRTQAGDIKKAIAHKTDFLQRIAPIAEAIP